MLNNKDKPIFLSLRWKYALTISAVLLFILIVLNISFFYKNNQRFEHQLKSEFIQQTKILSDLIKQSEANIGQFIDSVNQLQLSVQNYKSQPLNEKPSPSIRTLIEKNWLDWKIIWGYENINLYLKKSKQSYNWGTPSAHLERLYQLVIQTEHPQRIIHCHKNCLLYIATPLLKQGELVGVLSVGKSMAEILINFKKITQSDIGIILLDKNSSIDITAITNSKVNKPLLRKLFPLKKYKPLIAQKFTFKKDSFCINTSPIFGNKQANFVFIKNISTEVKTQLAEKNNILIIGIISLVSTFILLYTLLHFSVIKIRTLSKALPFLSTSKMGITDKYQQSRQLLSQQKRFPFFTDELDQLQATSLHLCNQLEQLEIERELARKQSMWVATHDELTNLYNRRYFQKEFEQQISTAKRYDRKIALFYLDLDQFKIINDRHGHDAGDKLLIEVASTLNKLIRNTDTLCRIGGDEFAILTPVTDTVGVMSLAIKINHTLNEMIFKQYKNSYHIGASIGIAIYPTHGNNIHDLLTNADLAMYKAKETSFNIYHIYDREMDYHQELNKKLDWKVLIEQSIKNNWLNLYYQPIMDLKTSTISHYECLLRVIKDTGEMIMPADFIQYAEELGLIETIDIMIINLAIKKHIQMQEQGKLKLKLAINLSGRSLSNDKVKIEIKRLLALPEVQADKIIFEITETSAVTNFNIAQSFISEIKALGCSIALDDFGTGFSSFFYLKNMTVDYIKIDGSFIQRIESDKEDKIFVKALSDVARALNKKTIAEFVETESVINILKELDIDYAQGYHISKPLADIPD